MKEPFFCYSYGNRVTYRVYMILSSEIPACFVVVEFDAICTAEVGEDLHDVILLLGCEHVFTMMETIIRAHAFAKV